MLDVTGDHVRKLSDEQLRLLVARLCEAELQQAALPLSALIAGGDQNAADGGIDVRVELPGEAKGLDFIPRPNTGFQSKAADMPAEKIQTEMRPDGVLRPVIVELADKLGAYIIVSSKGSVSDSALRKRRVAMADAVADAPSRAAILLDFYDRNRLAGWVRKYPGVALWLREAIGEPVSGWRGYGNWARGDKPDSEYLLDETTRVISTKSQNHEATSAGQGIGEIRGVLRKAGGIVRLVGLSGVGKTRLVQALFDAKVGDEALDIALAIYTDLSHEPNPTPRDMLHRLIASGQRAIMVVDNCNPGTHRALAEMMAAGASNAGLITVEYDVADDEPEDTLVFKLEPASETVLVQILERLAPHVSHGDRHRIADVAGGNARIALALAGTIKHGASLGVLNDGELFNRLFHQHRSSNDTLLKSAEVCSLVYSFQGEAIDGDAAELPVLAGLADLKPSELFRSVGELQTRDLVQNRGKWRAVLPHAIANRLAREALAKIPREMLTRSFGCRGRERLLRSFGRRLGYLHDSPQAIDIARTWFSDPRWLAKPATLNELQHTLFFSLAPLVPNLVLQVIEAASAGEGSAEFLRQDTRDRHKWAWLLRALSYDAELFERAAYLLARFLASEPKRPRDNSSNTVFTDLFRLYLSGTHAAIEQRLRVIRRLIDSEEAKLEELGLQALAEMLHSGQFRSSHDFSFGARPRDFGWKPRTNAELSAWYRAGLSAIIELASRSSKHKERAKAILAGSFRQLWFYAGIDEDLSRVLQQLTMEEGWMDGWVSVKVALKYQPKQVPSDLVERLRNLERDLRPRDVKQRVRAFVLSKAHGNYDLADADGDAEAEDGIGYPKSLGRMNDLVEALGEQLADDPVTLDELLPALLGDDQGRQRGFGYGLASKVPDVAAMWGKLCAVLSSIQKENRNIALLGGFIAGAMKREPETTTRLLESAISDPILGPSYPALEVSVRIDDAGAARIRRSLLVKLAPAWIYRNLSYGGVSDDISSSMFKEIVLGVANLEDGFQAAVDILGMRLYHLRSEKREVDQQTLNLGRELLKRCDFESKDGNLDFHVAEIAKACLRGPGSQDAVLSVCQRFAHALGDYRSGAWHFDNLARELFQAGTTTALDTFLTNAVPNKPSLLSNLVATEDNGSPVNQVPDEQLREWANQDPSSRYVALAKEIPLFVKPQAPEEWNWSPLALYLLNNAPNRADVLQVFAWRLQPRSWSGSLADVLTPYLRAVQKLGGHKDPAVRAWAVEQEQYLIGRITRERENERHVDQRFE